MNIQRKFWLVLIGTIAGMVIIACSTSSLIPTKATPTPAPLATLAPLATSAATAAPATLDSVVTFAPIATSVPATSSPATGLEAMPGLAGKWVDPDSTNGDTVSMIVWSNGTYVVTSVINSSRGQNELKTYSWVNGVLTWEYCPSTMQHCIIQNTVTLGGDTLTVDWSWSGGGNSGTSDLQRQ
jgi:hypothetical protein